MSQSSDTRYPDRAPTPSPQARRLGALLGRWRSEGYIVGDPPVPITGTDTYEWLAGGFFLVHHVDVVIGQQQVQALELLGEYDPTTDSFTARAYDNQGNVTVMRARVDEQGVWRFSGGGDVAAVARPASAEAGGAWLDADDQPGPSRHDGQVGAQRRRCQLAAVDGHDLHPDAELEAVSLPSSG
jgi:hypothetical protein